MKIDRTDILIAQVTYTEEEIDAIFTKWQRPRVDDVRSSDDLRKIFESTEKSCPEKRIITYTVAKFDVRTVSQPKTCRSPCHGPGGFSLNKLNRLYVRVDNALTIPSGLTRAFWNPIYLCLSKNCTENNLPVRTIIYKERIPSDVKLNENDSFTDADINKIVSEGFIIS